jgi:hypothetical protein
VERPNLPQTYVPMYVAGPNQDAALIAAAPALLRQLADGWEQERAKCEYARRLALDLSDALDWSELEQRFSEEERRMLDQWRQRFVNARTYP